MDWENMLVYAELLAVAILTVLILRTLIRMIEIRQIEQHQRLAIYRLGRLQRIAGPGLVWWIRRLHQPITLFEIREKPIEVEVPGVFINGRMVSITFNIWCIFDPQQALDGDLEQIHAILQLQEWERIKQIRILAKDLLTEELTLHVQRHPLPPEPQLGDQLAPILFGSTQREELLTCLRPLLAEEMRGLGYRLSERRPVTISNLGFADKFSEGLGRGQVVDLWRKQFPTLSDSELAQYIATYDGMDMSTVRKLIVESGSEIQVEQRSRSGDSEERIKVRTIPAGQTVQTGEAGASDLELGTAPSLPPAQLSSPPPPSSEPTIDYRLAKADLEYLRPVPAFGTSAKS